MENNRDESMKRVIEESVPGKQVTISHIIASPMVDIYERLGIDNKGAIGILTISPFEASIIAADIATKVADVEIGFLDRFTGSLIICGDVESVEVALQAVNDTLKKIMNFTICPISRT